MEGKGVLFKRFAGIDVFDIEVNAESLALLLIRLLELLVPLGVLTLRISRRQSALR